MSADAAPISAADAALVERYLEHVRVEKRLAERTLALYSLDLEKLAQFAAQSGVALTTVGNHHVRRWVAQMHAGGRSGRGIALILSGWRGFYAWLGREGLISANPVNDAPRQYLNRLSDLLFVLGRVLNRAGGRGDVLWQKSKNA